MKICLAFPKARTGGSYVFLRNFRAYLEAHHYDVTDKMDSEAYDVLFFNSWTIPYNDILQLKQHLPNLRIVQRVDGSAQDYGRLDGADWLQRDLNELADLTIFQSRYSYDATHTRYGLIKLEGPIIYNPVDVDGFSPEGDRMDWETRYPKRVISVGWSLNPMKGNWRIPILAWQNPDVEFVVVGRVEGIELLPNIRTVAYLEHDELPNALRSADAYLSLIQNDACPNVILEAMACGLPILYVPSGGVPELVRDAGLPFQKDEKFAPQLNQILADRSALSQRARQLTLEHHHPDYIFARYIDAIAECQRLPRRQLPSKWVNLRGYGDHLAYEARQFIRKWGRILTGKQPLRRQR